VTPVLSVRGLQFQFGGRPVLTDCSFEARAGQMIGLLGRNGAGKTTLFRLIAGLYPSDPDQLHIGGRSADRARQDSVVAFVPDMPLLYPRLSLEENMAAFALLWGVPSRQARARAEDLMKRLDLWEHRRKYVQDLSRGMKQKASIIAGLLPTPQLLLLDEPTNGLDYTSVRSLKQLLDTYRQEGGCVLMSSHSPDVLHDYVTDLLLLTDGRISTPPDPEVFFADHGFERFFAEQERHAGQKR